MPIKKTDFRDVKKINRNLLYRYLYKRQPLARQDIANALHLSLPTATKNINELIDLGLLMCTKKIESTGGRRATAIKPNYHARYAIGLDVTTHHLGIVIIDLGCNVIYFKRHNMLFENKKEYFQDVGKLINDAVTNNRIPRKKILGVGIGIPAIVSADHKSVIFNPVIDYKGGKLSSFEQYIEYPCIMTNDANAAGFSEFWHRGNDKNLFYISLSNSVGGAFLVNGEIYDGDNRRSGEIGHLTVSPDGPPCYCTKRGCMNVYCNAKQLSDLAEGDLEKFFRKLKEENMYSDIWEKYLDNLSIAINSLNTLFDCDIVLGGYVGAYLNEYLPDLRKRVEMRNTFYTSGAAFLETCIFKFEAIAVGAALYFVDDFIKKI